MGPGPRGQRVLGGRDRLECLRGPEAKHPLWGLGSLALADYGDSGGSTRPSAGAGGPGTARPPEVLRVPSVPKDSLWGRHTT